MQWINGGGYYLVHATRKYSKEEIKRDMDLLEMKLRKAEILLAEKKT